MTQRSALVRLAVLLLYVACAASALAAAPPGRYSASKATVKDNKTGLTWQRTVEANAYTWADAKSYCEQLTLSGGGWRLPTCNELLTLVDPMQGGSEASIDSKVFPDTPATYFWTASPLVDNPADAWFVNFGYGSANYTATSTAYRVRCVR